jgi:hypothetical protein
MKAFWLMLLSISFASGQSNKPNLIFNQAGAGGSFSIPTYANVVINTSVDYERSLYEKDALHFGARTGAGICLAPMGFFGFEATQKVAHHFELSGSMKLGRKRHMFGLDAGYACVKWKDRFNELQYHIPTVVIAYIYQAPRGFHLRGGFSSWRGPFIGIGVKF